MAEERLEEIRQARLKKRQELIDAGLVPYPAEVRRTHTLTDLNTNFDSLLKDSVPVVVLGRITSIRTHGGVAFMDIADGGAKIQLQLTKDQVDESVFAKLETLDVGDFIEASGELTLTARGVKTVQTKQLAVISKSVRPLPQTWFGLKDHETRYRQRELDLLLNEDVRTVFLKRSQLVMWLRTYLTNAGFMEVETPMLQSIAGGTLAKPFTTHHNALDIDLYLRIAPELYLKRLVVGGYEKVFEIGRNFRNEGVDREHNPEFTMLEFYQAYADYEDLMDMAEDMLANVTKDITGSTDVNWLEKKLSFSTPIKRERYVEVVSQRLGIDILAEKNPEIYLNIFKKENLELPTVKTYTKLVDELYKELIRPTIIQPTILYDYPVEMVPLGKRSAKDERVAEMFQLVVAGMEIIKAYTELNDPVEQRARFEEQMTARAQGDDEAHAIDESYLRALEYGLPPTGGFGLGVDRLAMLLTNSANLRDTILFPLLKPE